MARDSIEPSIGGGPSPPPPQPASATTANANASAARSQEAMVSDAMTSTRAWQAHIHSMIEW